MLDVVVLGGNNFYRANLCTIRKTISRQLQFVYHQDRLIRLHRERLAASATLFLPVDFVVWFFGDFYHVRSKVDPFFRYTFVVIICVFWRPHRDYVAEAQLVAHLGALEFERKHHPVSLGDQIGHIVEPEHGIQICCRRIELEKLERGLVR